MILIVGSNGSMGKRYQSILKSIGVSYSCADKDKSMEEVKEMTWSSKGIILATPTDSHYKILKELLPFNLPILCEKPITKNLDELDEVLSLSKSLGCYLDMVYQYKYLVDLNSVGPSVYSYFRHGNDGLVWDCMQIIGLAKGKISLYENSPIWNCMINGKFLNFSHMDLAYVKQIKDWIKSPSGNHEEIHRVHKKAYDFEKDFINKNGKDQ